MDLKKNLGVLALIGLGLYGGYRSLHQLKLLVHTPDRQSAVQSTAEVGFAKQLGSPKEKLLAKLTKSKLAADECGPYVSALEKLSFDPAKAATGRPTYEQVPKTPGACLVVDDAVEASDKAYLKECQLSNAVQTEAVSPACVTALVDVRASFTHYLYRETKLSEIEGLPELTDLLYFEFSKRRILQSSNQQAQLDYAKLASIAHEMLTTDADFARALRVVSLEAVTDALHSTKSKTLREQDALWSQAKDAFDQFQKLQPSYFSNFNENVVIETRGYDPVRLMTLAAASLEKDPNSGSGLLLKAFADWKAGDHSDAFQALKKASELNPKADEYLQILQKLSEAGASDEAFLTPLQFDLSQADFDR